MNSNKIKFIFLLAAIGFLLSILSYSIINDTKFTNTTNIINTTNITNNLTIPYKNIFNWSGIKNHNGTHFITDNKSNFQIGSTSSIDWIEQPDLASSNINIAAIQFQDKRIDIVVQNGSSNNWTDIGQTEHGYAWYYNQGNSYMELSDCAWVGQTGCEIGLNLGGQHIYNSPDIDLTYQLQRLLNSSIPYNVLQINSTGLPEWAPIPYSGTVTYFLSNVSSWRTGYYIMNQSFNATRLINVTTYPDPSNNQFLVGYMQTNESYKLSVIPSGTAHTYLSINRVGTGNKKLYIYTSIRKHITTIDYEVILGNSTLSPEIIEGFNNIVDLQTIFPFTSFNTTDHLEVEIYSYTIGSGGTPDLTISVDDMSNSRVVLPYTAVDVSSFVPYQGATSNIDMGNKSIINVNGNFPNATVPTILPDSKNYTNNTKINKTENDVVLGVLNFKSSQLLDNDVAFYARNNIGYINTVLASTTDNRIYIGAPGGWDGIWMYPGSTSQSIFWYDGGINAQFLPTMSTTTSALCIDGTGNISYNSGLTTCLASTERMKTNISYLQKTDSNIINKFMQIKPIRYKTINNSIYNYGISAEDMNQVFPELVGKDKTGNVTGVKYENLAGLSVLIIQEQNEKINAMNNTLNKICKNNPDLCV